MSAPAGFPTWEPLILDLLSWAEREGLPLPVASLRETARAGELDLVADRIVRTLRREELESSLYSRLHQIFVEQQTRIPARHRLLLDIGLSAALTTNSDPLLERVFKCPEEAIMTPYDSDRLLTALTKREFFISKLYGRPEDPRSILLAPSQYTDSIVGNRVFAKFMESLFVSRTILFVGCSLDGILAYLSGIQLRSSTQRHYALVAVSGRVWEAQAEQLRDRYGIEVLPYAENEEHPEVADFLRFLAQRVGELRPKEDGSTEISPTASMAEIESLPGRPLENEGWPALGFPPLRAVSWRPAKEQARDDGRKLPVPDDLLPLLSGDPDPRLDDLKDWIYSFEFWSRDAGPAGAEIRADLFRVLREIMGDLQIDYRKNDDEMQRVMVSIQGRSIPIEAVSQGTASLFGWVGGLLRRLYRIYEEDPEALKRPALVLLDEIDAHMHPAWQQALAPRLQKTFPQVQFIATTHSPLVLSNVEDGAIYRFAWDEESRQATAHRAKKPVGYGVSGLLTSDFFGLHTELDDATMKLLDDKIILMAGSEPRRSIRGRASGRPQRRL